ncbi:MAG: SRPBCC family protein [Candidatus Dormibacteraeota bacterium]|nr:SRPBCC family protein [Candidatus Dormibacteraeota bacterium]
MTEQARGAVRTLTRQLPTDRLKSELRNLASAAGDRAISSLQEQAGAATERLTEYANGQGGPGLMAALTGAGQLAEGKSPARALLGAGMAGAKGKLGGLFGGGKDGKGGRGRNLKVTNIEESIDIGVPVRVAYNQWTQFEDFPSFMKKVERADQEEDEKLNWKAQVLWSHREWQATISKQVPDRMITWHSEGQKGHVDGTVTFHALAPDLTRILMVLEYHPQGFFEHTGNLWRAQGRRVRLELKHFRRHVMTQVIEHPDEVEGWRGVIEEGEVVKDHETAVREEREAGQDDTGAGHEPDEAGDEYETDDEYEPAEDEDEPAEAADDYEPDEEGEAGEEFEPEEAADEYDEQDERREADGDRELAGAGRSGRRPRRR